MTKRLQLPGMQGLNLSDRPRAIKVTVGGKVRCGEQACIDLLLKDNFFVRAGKRIR